MTGGGNGISHDDDVSDTRLAGARYDGVPVGIERRVSQVAMGINQHEVVLPLNAALVPAGPG